MTILEDRPARRIPQPVVDSAAAAAGIDPLILERAVDVALAGGPDTTEPGWREWAACRGQGSGPFFPDHAAGKAVRERLERCQGCPVQDACLGAALEAGEQHGLWGGTTSRGRFRIRKVLRDAGILGVVGEDAYLAWREEGADREPRPHPSGPRRLDPWPHQLQAVDAIVAELAGGGRCQVSLATASGKTLVSVWAATALDVDQVVVLVPSLSLITQSAETWARDERWGSARQLAVCSDTGELDLEATTDPMRVREFLDDGGRCVVFATYQSAGVVAAAGRSIEFCVADEAHHVAGEKDKAFGAIVRGEIPAERILFMTATPRTFRRRQRDIELVSMDDTTQTGFGPRVFEFALADAVDAGVVADYRVVVAAVEREVFERVAAHPALVDVDPHLLAGAIAVVRAAGEYDLASCISFHTRIERARTFAHLIGPVTEALEEIRPAGPGWSGWLHGGTSVRIRQRLLDRLADDRSWGVLANARALGEGVDLPVLDAVAIVDPKNSEADVLQATGRALRKPSGSRKVGTVLLPVLLTGEVDPADPLAGLDPRSLEVVSGVLRALRSHDSDLGGRLDAARRQLAKETVKDSSPHLLAALQRRHASRAFLRSRVEMWVPGGATGELAGAMAVHLVRETTAAWEEAFARLEAYVAEHGHARVRQSERPGDFWLGQWSSRQRTLRARGFLERDRERRLEQLPGWSWDPRNEQWWSKFDALADYMRAHPGPAPGRSGAVIWQGVDLGQFVNVTRSAYPIDGKDGGWIHKFPDRIAALEALPGWVWNAKDAEWELNFERLQRWVAVHGHAQPSAGDLVDGFDIGKWVSKQRSRINGNSYLDNRRGLVREESLNEDRTARLRALPGWVDHTREASWEEGYARLAAFVDEHGYVPTHETVLPGGYTLGRWIQTQRSRYARDKMPAERIARMEQIPGWLWTPWAIRWDAAFEILERYANSQHRPILRIPLERVEDFDLNAWCTNQRRDYRAGTMPPARVQLFEQRIRGWAWDPTEAKFDAGVDAVRRYITREGHCEPPVQHREGIVALRAWISQKRALYRAGQLEPDRIRKLEAINGWTWEPTTTPSRIAS